MKLERVKIIRGERKKKLQSEMSKLDDGQPEEEFNFVNQGASRMGTDMGSHLAAASV